MKKLAMIGAALLCAGELLAAEESADRVIRKAFRVESGGTLTIRADRGSIDVVTGAGDKVEIEVTREPGPRASKDILEKHTVTFSQEGNAVLVKAEMPRELRNQGWFSGGNNMKVHYAVTVPRKFNVALNSAGGSISVQDLEGEARAATSGGALKFGKINGLVNGRSSGGSITVSGATQDVDIHTSGGGIRVGDVGGKVVARTSGGSIRIGKVLGSVVAETSGGSIEVDGAAGQVTAQSSGGPIRAAFTAPLTAPCSLETSGGGIEVKLASASAVAGAAHTRGGSV